MFRHKPSRDVLQESPGGAETLAKALGGRKVGVSWIAPCPVHDDRKPSLAIRDASAGKVLVHCHAGCNQMVVVAELCRRGLWEMDPRWISRLVNKRVAADSGKRRAVALSIWEATDRGEGTLAQTYLRSRGLVLQLPPTLRFHKGLKHPSEIILPALVALVTRAIDDAPIAIHRTFLARDGSGKAPVEPQRMMLGPCRGGAVRLGRLSSTMMVGEGIETCLSAMQATGIPAFAALSTSGLRTLTLPVQVRNVIVLADGDDAGEAAAQECAFRFRCAGHGVRIARPPMGLDFNDLLVGRASHCSGGIAESSNQAEGLIAGATEAAEEIGRAVGGSIELRDLGLPQRDVLLTICDDAQFWRSHEGETFATVPVGDHLEHWALNSRAFRDWALGQLARRYSQNGRPASVGANAVKDALQAVEARASFEGIRNRAPLRAAEHDGEIYLDRGTPDWSAFRITAGAWDIVPRPPVPILRSKRTGPFPYPAEPDLKPLRQLLKRLTDNDFVLFISWCLAALTPVGPYPILIISGEAGSGKSTMVRLAQRIVDPVTGDLLQPPGNDRDLIAAAKHGRVLAFDNLSGISAELADSLCRLATGSEIGGRALYTDSDTASFAACRPLIINGIPDLAARGDLADRAIVTRLGPLDDRITERDWWKAVEQALPSALAALLNALAFGVNRLDEVPTPDVRMADFARLIVAAEPALPWGDGCFLAAYAENREYAINSLIEGDMVASLLMVFAKEQAGRWTGLKSVLFGILSSRVPPEAKRSADWPGNARWFSDRLRRATPALRARGVRVTERRVAEGVEVTILLDPTTATAATASARSRATALNGSTAAGVANVVGDHFDASVD